MHAKDIGREKLVIRVRCSVCGQGLIAALVAERVDAADLVGKACRDPACLGFLQACAG